MSLQSYANGNWNNEGASSRTVGLTLSLKPSPMLTISVGPQWNRSATSAQYVRTVVDPTAVATYGERDVFGWLDQTQFSMTTRVNAILTPRLSLQLYAQPLLAVGGYSGFKELAQPRTYQFFMYGGTASTINFEAPLQRYVVDPDAAGPAEPFSFSNPDFNFKSLQVNTVLRWELKPGSALYAVWTRQQQDDAYPGNFSLRRDASALWSARGDDVFLVKVAYWIGR